MHMRHALFFALIPLFQIMAFDATNQELVIGSGSGSDKAHIVPDAPPPRDSSSGRSLSAPSITAAKLMLQNRAMIREFSTAEGRLSTSRIVNSLNGRVITPTACPEFRLRISQGTHIEGHDITLTAADFQVTGVKSDRDKSASIAFSLTNTVHQLAVEVVYTARPEDFYARKHLLITSAKPVTLEYIEVEALSIPDAYQPYTKDDITAFASGKWNPGIGQPLYTANSGTFWGLEFPAARNQVRDNELSVGYFWGREIKSGQPYKTYSAVLGATDNADCVADAFQSYIDQIRCRPMRLRVQYNTWMDYRVQVNRENFAVSVAKIHEELVTARGCQPLQCYVIDDGWQDAMADWSDKVWKVNTKFDPDFASSLKVVEDAKSKLGLWLSPGCLFGGHRQVPKLREQGFEAMDNWMSMAGPKYMQSLEDRMAELVTQGVSFFKLDGIFGHLNLRNFELHGDRYGIPYMPQLGLDGLNAGSPELNSEKYNELKLYYLTAGTERLMALFNRLAKINPDIYILISNGAYLSPWWLTSVDAVWMINAGDSGSGTTRTGKLVYRDSIYYRILKQDHTQFPLNAIFNHEPKITAKGEQRDVLRKYLYMSLSRATGFEELYLKPSVLGPGEWDVISEGLSWSESVFPAFKRARMHGGDPSKEEVYGYTGWTETQGYISLHNPSAKPHHYTMMLDRAFGLVPGSGPFQVSSPLPGNSDGLANSVAFGSTLAVDLAPYEVRILNFDKGVRDWSRIRSLQARTPESTIPSPKAADRR